MASPAATTTKCFFLDSLPPELRLSVYEYLILAPEPLRGKSTRQQRTGLDLAIFRTNRQFYQEARALFLGRNTFYVTSVSNNASADGPYGRGGDEQAEPYEPSFSKADMPLVRHLVLDPVHRSVEAIDEMADDVDAWQAADPAAARYIQALTHLLRSAQLRSLRITATPPSHYTAKQCLTSFFMADRDRAFAAALAAHTALKEVRVSFEFPDCYYRASVPPEAFLQRSILLLACRVMFCQSQTRIHRLMVDFDEAYAQISESGQWKGERPRVDLEPLVKRSIKFYPRVSWLAKSPF